MDQHQIIEIFVSFFLCFIFSFLLSISIISKSICVATIVRTHFATLDPYRCALVWDYVLSLPVRVKDLPRDASIIFSIWSESGELFGTTFTCLFNAQGVLKSGKQKMIFHRAKKSRDADDNEVIGPLPSDKDYLGRRRENEYETKYAHCDSSFQLEKKLEHYKRSLLKKLV